MPLPGKPVRFVPMGLSDTLDATESFPGAMLSLRDLIPDPSTKGVFQCRPAATNRFAGLTIPFQNPGYISIFKIIGSRVYGLMATSRNPGYDEPFCFDLNSGAFVTVKGVDAGNVPLSPATQGDWIPATADLISTKLIVTHPGFVGSVPVTSTGTIQFLVNPVPYNTITLNGTVITFVASTATLAANQVAIGTDTGPTLANLLKFLKASTDPNLTAATYTIGNKTLSISATNAGSYGNSYTLAVSGAATPSGATLTGGTGGFFGWFDLTDPTTITWYSGNTAVNPLPYYPSAVIQFNGRANFVLNPPAGGEPGLLATDALNPLVMTNGTYVLTFGDNLPLTAVGGLALNNQLGGVIQSLIVFKGVTNMYQVTGDPGLGTWTINTLNAATGTLSPRSVCPTPKGLMFMSPDGLRLIDFSAHVSDVIGLAGDGVAVPFINALEPSRLVAAANATVLRISAVYSAQTGIATAEYWFDMARNVWTGPHSFPAALIAPYGTTFIMAPAKVTGSLWQSDAVQSAGSSFIEDAVPMSWSWQTSLLPDADTMSEMSMIEATLSLANVSTATGASAITVTAYDQDQNVYDAEPIPAAGTAPLWGASTWGSFTWGGARLALYPAPVQWAEPIVYRRLSICATGQSSAGLKLGSLFLRLSAEGYLGQPQ